LQTKQGHKVLLETIQWSIRWFSFSFQSPVRVESELLRRLLDDNLPLKEQRQQRQQQRQEFLDNQIPKAEKEQGQEHQVPF